MDFELRRAREKLEKEQKERKEKARQKLERERGAKQEAIKQREAIEAAQRSKRLDAAEAQLKVLYEASSRSYVCSGANSMLPFTEIIVCEIANVGKDIMALLSYIDRTTGNVGVFV